MQKIPGMTTDKSEIVQRILTADPLTVSSIDIWNALFPEYKLE